MSDKKIKELLDKYFAAETSLEEEEQLRQFFSGNDIPEQWLPYRPMFQYFSAFAKQNPPEDFEQKLLKNIRQQQKPHRIDGWKLLPYAAAITLLLTLTCLFSPFAEKKTKTAQNIQWEQYEPKSEEEALQETIAALRLLAEKLNGSKKATVKEIQKMDKITNPTADN